MSERCKHVEKNGFNCGSYAFNLYKDGIDQGNLCDVHYWQAKALAQPEPYDQTALELCNVCGWKTLIPDDACLNCERAQPEQEALYGMNQDDWKDVVAAIAKVRDGRGIYLACRPADVFQDWFLALGTAKVKEKNT